MGLSFIWIALAAILLLMMAELTSPALIDGGGRSIGRLWEGRKLAAAADLDVEIREFGETEGGGKVSLATLQRGPIQISLMNWGARIQALRLPDAHGNTADVVLGFNSFDEYKNQSADPYFAAVVGRAANRIAGGTFVLDNVYYNLSRNDGNNMLHGGKVGFDKVLWKGSVKFDNMEGTPYLEYKYHSYDGEQGDLHVTVTYKLTSKMELVVDMNAVAGNKTTPVNMAQHTYWNLGGQDSGTILNNTIQIAGDRITVVDKALIPTGELMDVKGTPYDLTSPAVIGSRIGEVNGGGFDVNYELKGGKVMKIGGEALHFAARVVEPESGRVMEVYTNKPGLQFYTSNSLEGVKGKGGVFYNKYDALCLETQGFPDAVNHPNFPSVLVQPGHTYHHRMLYRFSILSSIRPPQTHIH